MLKYLRFMIMSRIQCRCNNFLLYLLLLSYLSVIYDDPLLLCFASAVWLATIYIHLDSFPLYFDTWLEFTTKFYVYHESCVSFFTLRIRHGHKKLKHESKAEPNQNKGIGFVTYPANNPIRFHILILQIIT